MLSRSGGGPAAPRVVFIHPKMYYQAIFLNWAKTLTRLYNRRSLRSSWLSIIISTALVATKHVHAATHVNLLLLFLLFLFLLLDVCIATSTASAAVPPATAAISPRPMRAGNCDGAVRECRRAAK